MTASFCAVFMAMNSILIDQTRTHMRREPWNSMPCKEADGSSSTLQTVALHVLPSFAPMVGSSDLERFVSMPEKQTVESASMFFVMWH
jgi:hypothetical protein